MDDRGRGGPRWSLPAGPDRAARRGPPPGGWMDDDGSGEGADSGGPPPAWTPIEEAIEPASSERPRTTAQRILETAAWIVGALALAFFGRVYALVSGPRALSAEEIGRLVGGVVGGVLLCLFLLRLVVQIRHPGRV